VNWQRAPYPSRVGTDDPHSSFLVGSLLHVLGSGYAESSRICRETFPISTCCQRLGRPVVAVGVVVKRDVPAGAMLHAVEQPLQT
jgi:hypothetical protein